MDSSHLTEWIEGLSRPHLIMPYHKWLTHSFDPWDLIINASATDGSDYPVQHPIGLSVFITEALPADPRDLQITAVHDWDSDYLANAIFRLETTRKKGQLRRAASRQLKNKNWIFQHLSPNEERLPAAETWDWYQRTPFTLSPRGHGLDCHRTYEALFCKSIPIVMGADEELKRKYDHLPVKFVDTYDILTKGLLRDWYEELLEQEFDFNYLSRAYWMARREDVDITYESAFWLKRFQRFDHVAKYFRESDWPHIDRANPEPHPSAVPCGEGGGSRDDAGAEEGDTA